jgi:hypothetical protein
MRSAGRSLELGPFGAKDLELIAEVRLLPEHRQTLGAALLPIDPLSQPEHLLGKATPRRGAALRGLLGNHVVLSERPLSDARRFGQCIAHDRRLRGDTALDSPRLGV